MRTAKSTISQRSSKSPADSQSPYLTKPERFINSPGRFTQQLKSRKKFIQSVSPEQASEVIKNYIIPLFEHKIKYKSLKHKTDIKDSRFSISNSKGPMGEELLLSSKLYEKLKRSEESKKRLAERCGEIEQGAEINLHEGKYYENMWVNSEINVKGFCFELNLMQKELNGKAQTIEKLNQEKEFFKGQFESCQIELRGKKEALETLELKFDIRLFFIYIP